jgi:THO complex subunit 2
LPALALTQSNPARAEDLWMVVREWDHATRWRLYIKLQRDIPAQFPVVWLAGCRASHELKQIMKRLTVANANLFCPTVAKITHGQALPVFDALLNLVCGYPADQTTISPAVDICKKNTHLSHDILMFILLTKVCDPTKEKMKEDGVYPSQWFANLSLYLAVFLRKVRLFHGGRPQMVPVLHFFFNQIACKGDAVISVMLSDFLTDVAGMGVSPILSDRQISAHAGGPILINVACGPLASAGHDTSAGGTLISSRLDRDKSSAVANLRNALTSADLTEQLAIGIARLPVRVVFHEDYASTPLRVASSLVDRTMNLFMQFTRFLALPDSKAISRSLLKTGPAVLISRYMLPPWAAFTMLRPMLEYLEIFPSESVKVDIGANGALPGAPFGPDGTVASESSAATPNRRDGASVFSSSLPPIIPNIDVHGAGLVDKRLKGLLSAELFLTFWVLDIGDLFVPVETYAAESSRLSLAIDAWKREIASPLDPTDANPEKTKEKRRNMEAEVTHMEDITGSIGKERADRVERQSSILARLRERRKHWVLAENASPGSAAALNTVAIYLEQCVLPRCVLSGHDASYCARFTLLLMSLDVPALDMATYYSTLLEALSAKVLTASEGEANHVGCLLRETLHTLDRWRTHSEQFDRECLKKTFGGFRSHQKEVGEEASSMSHKEYCDWLFVCHESVVQGFEPAFMTGEHMMLRNTLNVLNRVSDVFPKVDDHAKILATRVAGIRDNSHMEDIRTAAFALHSVLCRTKALPQHVFRLRPISKPPQSVSGVAGQSGGPDLERADIIAKPKLADEPSAGGAVENAGDQVVFTTVDKDENFAASKAKETSPSRKRPRSPSAILSEVDTPRQKRHADEPLGGIDATATDSSPVVTLVGKSVRTENTSPRLDAERGRPYQRPDRLDDNPVPALNDNDTSRDADVLPQGQSEEGRKRQSPDDGGAERGSKRLRDASGRERDRGRGRDRDRDRNRAERDRERDRDREGERDVQRPRESVRERDRERLPDLGRGRDLEHDRQPGRDDRGRPRNRDGRDRGENIERDYRGNHESAGMRASRSTQPVLDRMQMIVSGPRHDRVGSMDRPPRDRVNADDRGVRDREHSSIRNPSRMDRDRRNYHGAALVDRGPGPVGESRVLDVSMDGFSVSEPGGRMGASAGDSIAGGGAGASETLVGRQGSGNSGRTGDGTRGGGDIAAVRGGDPGPRHASDSGSGLFNDGSRRAFTDGGPRNLADGSRRNIGDGGPRSSGDGGLRSSGDGGPRGGGGGGLTGVGDGGPRGVVDGGSQKGNDSVRKSGDGGRRNGGDSVRRVSNDGGQRGDGDVGSRVDTGQRHGSDTGARGRGEGGGRVSGEGGAQGSGEGIRGSSEGGVRGGTVGDARGAGDGGPRGNAEGGFRGGGETALRGSGETGHRGSGDGGYRGSGDGGLRGGGDSGPRGPGDPGARGTTEGRARGGPVGGRGGGGPGRQSDSRRHQGHGFGHGGRRRH